LRLEVSEPSCNEKELYDSAGVDIFQKAGDDGIIAMPIHTTRPAITWSSCRAMPTAPTCCAQRNAVGDLS